MHTSIDTGASGPEILFLRGTSSDTLGIPGMRAILPRTFTTVSTILFEERSIPGRYWEHTENYGTTEKLLSGMTQMDADEHRNYGKAFKGYYAVLRSSAPHLCLPG